MLVIPPAELHDFSHLVQILQAPAVLLLDELTSFLDEGDQQSVLKAVRAAVDAGGVTAVWVRAAVVVRQCYFMLRN